MVCFHVKISARVSGLKGVLLTKEPNLLLGWTQLFDAVAFDDAKHCDFLNARKSVEVYAKRLKHLNHPVSSLLRRWHLCERILQNLPVKSGPSQPSHLYLERNSTDESAIMTLGSEFQAFDEPFGLCSPSSPSSRTHINYDSSIFEGTLCVLTRKLNLLKESLLNKDGFSKRLKDTFSQGCKMPHSL
ncbi:hypothetical protein TSMEX_005867 [Taenia solium]|eukprot:TsM_000252100 transcript=TsM_000252100 gene=TsM_000252100